MKTVDKPVLNPFERACEAWLFTPSHATPEAQKTGLASVGETPSPKHIMLVTQSTAMGGMEMHVQYLAAELVARRVRVSMVFPRDEAFDELSARCSRLGAK